MKKDLLKYGQYKNDILVKLDFDFEAGKKILDVGCGDGTDAEIFINEFRLDVYAIDIYKHDNIEKLGGLKFKKGSICQIPFDDNEFDYVFSHDILHHLDEGNQSYEKHITGLRELIRVTKKDGHIIIVEGNRYNPLFYPHMVLIRGHNHWRQSYFKRVIEDLFDNVEFRCFEAHAYPSGLKFWKAYELLMEKISPGMFLAYNVAIIKNNKK
ncbi:MAG: class I SAM-dependent methyltransferase [Candidatus Bathyarchaeota archaeon]|nr:class I SAM-dependent methyltransferase [Candidatus Bathyarchaeota archaeon]